MWQFIRQFLRLNGRATAPEDNGQKEEIVWFHDAPPEKQENLIIRFNGFLRFFFFSRLLIHNTLSADPKTLAHSTD
jgi:hypothetical protein